MLTCLKALETLTFYYARTSGDITNLYSTYLQPCVRRQDPLTVIGRDFWVRWPRRTGSACVPSSPALASRAWAALPSLPSATCRPRRARYGEAAAQDVVHGAWPDPGGLWGGRHFFECGGHSIAALKMASLARVGQVSLAVKDSCDHLVPGALSRLVEGRSIVCAGEAIRKVALVSLVAKSVNPEILKTRAADLCGSQPQGPINILTCIQEYQNHASNTAMLQYTHFICTLLYSLHY